MFFIQATIANVDSKWSASIEGSPGFSSPDVNFIIDTSLKNSFVYNGDGNSFLKIDIRHIQVISSAILIDNQNDEMDLTIRTGLADPGASHDNMEECFSKRGTVKQGESVLECKELLAARYVALIFKTGPITIKEVHINVLHYEYKSKRFNNVKK